MDFAQRQDAGRASSGCISKSEGAAVGRYGVEEAYSRHIVRFNGLFDEVQKPLHFGSLHIWDWGPRHRWPGWVFVLETIQHVNCGGDSDFQGSVTIGSLVTDLIIPEKFHVESLLRDLGSILESKAGGQEFVMVPSLKTLSKPVVTEVINDCFHPCGLFPMAIPEAKVIARFVFGIESKMVKQMLTPDEALQVYDVSPSVYG